MENPLDFVAQAPDQRVHRVAVAAKLFGVGIQPGFDPIHLSILDACLRIRDACGPKLG
jgi:hypothetical protein